MRRRAWIGLCLGALLLPDPGLGRALAAEPPNSEAGSPEVLPRPTGGPRWGLVASGAGLALGLGLGVWFKAEADDRYDAYLETADQARAAELFDQSQRYDRASLVGWAVAQAAFVGVFYFLTREEPDRLIPTEGEPLVRVSGEGVQVGWRLAP